MQVTLQDKIILITGGTGGLGQALVRTFIREKASVLFTFHSHNDRAVELEKLGARGFQADLSDRKSVNAFVDSVTKAERHLDGIIHNAGVSLDHTIANATEEEFDKSIEVNLTSVFRISRGLLPLLEKSKHAKILNVTSRVGLRGNFGQTAYSASKAGLIALTKTMAAEWGEKGISVNAITPGYVMSDMTRILPEEIHEKMKKESYLGVISEAKEVADFSAFLMSDQVTRVSGQIFHYDSRRI